jgi:WD40 repeat protein
VAVVVLLAVGLVAMTRSPEVVPASGPGSLPDQIFPTRQHILTLEQAPIGRVSMVYEGPVLGGVTSWVAVGADSDEYRFAAPSFVDPARTVVDVAPDGSGVAISHAGTTPDSLRVELLDAETGDSRSIVLPDEGRGGWVETLTWSPDGSRLAVLASVINGDDPDASSGRSWYFMVDVESEDVTRLPRDAVLAGEPAGWTSDGRLVLADQSRVSTVRVSAVSDQGVEPVEVLRGVPEGLSRFSLSPDGVRLAGLSDPTPGASGDGSVWGLHVYSLQTGDELLHQNLSRYHEDSSSVVGWRDASTPVVSAVRTDGGTGELIAYSSRDGSSEVLVRAGEAEVPIYYLTSRVASDVLAAGQIREAQPPEQPWYDPRTLGPAMAEWIVGHKFLVALIVVTMVGTIVVVARRRRVV